VLESISRLVNDVSTSEEIELASVARDCLSMYRKNEDIINLGAYTKGANARIDRAIRVNDEVMEMLRQRFTDHVSRSDSFKQLAEALK
jgi:flagellum-specific ATP synthase